MISMFNLEGRVAIVTGGNGGIGLGMAEGLAKAGAKIALVGRNSEKNAQAVSILEKQGVEVLSIEKDITEPTSGAEIASSTEERFGGIDILINNAGLAWGMEPSHKVDIKKWERMIDTNCKGLIYITRAVLPGLIKRNKGHIINIGSVAGTYPYAGGNVYGGTKAFVKQFSLGLKSDLLGTKVKITNIEPGMADTEFSLVRFSGNKKKANDVYKKMTPLYWEDIAETILWSVNRPSHVLSLIHI